MESNVVYCGDALQIMHTWPDGCVNCCVTSPPYWGLRDYGTGKWEGGDDACDHVDSVKLAERERQKKSMIAVGERIDGSTRTRVHDTAIGKDWQYLGACEKCGAKRIDQQLGLEKTPEEFVSKMVEIFAEVRRVLRDDGTLWLNLGDSYMGNCSRTSTGRAGYGNPREGVYDKTGFGLKTKDLTGIPWRVAMALQEPTYQCQWCKYKGRESLFGKFLNGAYSICPSCCKRHGNKQPVKVQEGWYLRQDIIWHKPNPMPESVGDRCTKAHEYIFLLSKSAKYYCDMEAIKEDAKDAESYSGRTFRGPKAIIEAKGRPGRQQTIDKGCPADGKTFAKVNKRSVWTVTTKPYSEAHFATFPPDLIEPCILAGCPENVCVKCSEPRVRIVEKSGGTTGESWHDHENDLEKGVVQTRGGVSKSTVMAQKMKENPYKVETTGWTDCGCNVGFRPGIVLDPFYGSGTTGMVSYNNNRNYVGIELNAEYIKLDRAEKAKEQLGLFS